MELERVKPGAIRDTRSRNNNQSQWVLERTFSIDTDESAASEAQNPEDRDSISCGLLDLDDEERPRSPRLEHQDSIRTTCTTSTGSQRYLSRQYHSEEKHYYNSEERPVTTRQSSLDSRPASFWIPMQTSSAWNTPSISKLRVRVTVKRRCNIKLEIKR